MARAARTLAVLALTALALPTVTGAATPVAADLVLTGGRIYTADATHSMAEAVAVKGDRIVFVGSAADARAWTGPATRIEHLDGRLVLPGLVDAHIHPLGIVQLDVCDLHSQAKSLAEMTEFVRGCIAHYQVADGAWLSVREWNYSNGNQPDRAHPTLRAALDLASTRHPIQLLGNDGHHGAFNSMALARAADQSGRTLGFSRGTLAGSFANLRALIGVDVAGEPNGTVNEEARARMDLPSIRAEDRAELMKDPGRMTERLNGAGITAVLDAAVREDALPFYDALEKSGRLTARVTLAQYFDPDVIRTPAGQPDWDRMVASARAVRARYANDPLIRADVVKLFADGVLEGNPYAVPPTPPEDASIRPYLQPIFGKDKDHHFGVLGYVDTASPECAGVRAHRADYESAAAAEAFLKEHGYHPAQCVSPAGQLQHERAVILEFVRRFHLAGFPVHIHAIGDAAIRTSVDAIEAARREDGVSSLHDALAHVQLVHPDDVARIGRDHLYLAFTYAWAYAEPEYDLSVVPYFDRVLGSDEAALHPAGGYYEQNAYPVRALQKAGATLIAGSDAPVDTRDPRPFVNMAMAVTRSRPGHRALNAAQSIPIRDVIDAYTRNGAQYLGLEHDAGSIEVGKSGDFIVVDRDILALADSGRAGEVAATKVLATYFQGKAVYRAARRTGTGAKPGPPRQ